MTADGVQCTCQVMFKYDKMIKFCSWGICQGLPLFASLLLDGSTILMEMRPPGSISPYGGTSTECKIGGAMDCPVRIVLPNGGMITVRYSPRVQGWFNLKVIWR